MIDKIYQLLLSFSRAELSFFILGIGSTIWFLIQIVPKTDHVVYSCKQVTVALGSSLSHCLDVMSLALHIDIAKNEYSFYGEGCLSHNFFMRNINNK